MHWNWFAFEKKSLEETVLEEFVNSCTLEVILFKINESICYLY